MIAGLRTELAAQGVQVTFAETPLARDQVAESNLLLFNSVPLEQLLAGPEAKASESHCGSCSALLEQETDCRAVEYDGQVYEAIPAPLIRQAALAALAAA